MRVRVNPTSLATPGVPDDKSSICFLRKKKLVKGAMSRNFRQFRH